MNNEALFYVLHMRSVFDKLCLIVCLINQALFVCPKVRALSIKEELWHKLVLLWEVIRICR